MKITIKNLKNKKGGKNETKKNIKKELKNKSIIKAVKLYYSGDENRIKVTKEFGIINQWKTSKVTNMSNLFKNIYIFNANIGDWDVSNVVNVSNMFKNCINFNQYIGDWNVENVIDMSGIFDGAINFNQSIEKWNTCKVIKMNNMFKNCKKFNKELNCNKYRESTLTKDGYYSWNTELVRDMSHMFNCAKNFNMNVDKLITNNVSNMSYMFANTKKFNKNLLYKSELLDNKFNLYKSHNLYNEEKKIFENNEKQKKLVKYWNVENVIDMSYMFANADNFNGLIDNWYVKELKYIDNMFKDARSFNRILLKKWIGNPSNNPKLLYFFNKVNDNEKIKDYNKRWKVDINLIPKNVDEYFAWDISKIKDNFMREY